MPATIRVVKGAVVVEGDLADGQVADVVRRCAGRSRLELWRGRYEGLGFLEGIAGLEDISLVNTRIGDAGALARVASLRRLFVNGVRIDAGFDFLAHLAKVEELSLLNLRGALSVPNLDGLAALRAFRVWGCKGFADASVLEGVPQLEEVELVDVGLEPDQLEAIVAKPSVRYVAARFGTVARNARFDEILAEHGKVKYRPA